VTPPDPWEIEVTPAVQRSLRRLDRNQRERLGEAIARLPEGDVRRLIGMEGKLRLRVGDWRVIFSQDHARHSIIVLKVTSRGTAYKA